MTRVNSSAVTVGAVLLFAAAFRRLPCGEVHRQSLSAQEEDLKTRLRAEIHGPDEPSDSRSPASSGPQIRRLIA